MLSTRSGSDTGLAASLFATAVLAVDRPQLQIINGTPHAVDVFYTPVHMKKGRPGILITVLCRPGQREAVEELLFAESTTLGVRRHEVARTALEREVVQVATAYGPVGVKLGRRAGRVRNAQPEFEDCRRAAAAAGVPVKEVWAAAVAAFREGERQP